jgi:hypothetical protein
MKSIFTLFISAFISLTITAQPQLSLGEITPVVGDVYNVYQADSAYSPGVGGSANMTWDFRNLNGYGQAYDYTVNYVTPSSTPDASYFPTSTVAESYPSTKGGTTYYKTNGNDVYMDGFTITVSGLGSVLVDINADNELIMTYPFTQGSNVADATITGTAYFFFVGPQTASISGNANTVADGYGTLLMPYGDTIKDVIRVLRNESYTATSTLGTTTINRTNIFFYATSSSTTTANKKFPLVAFYETNINGSSTKWVTSQLKMITGLDHLANTLEYIKVFPNPVKERINISFSLANEAKVSITLKNNLGQNVSTLLATQQLNNGSHNYSIDNTFASGVYFLEIDVDGRKKVEKIILE